MNRKIESLFAKYLDRHPLPVDFPSGEGGAPSLIVVIPCYDEAYVKDTLLSLRSADRRGLNVEVIVVVNSGELAPQAIVDFNKQTYDELLQLSNQWSDIRLTPVLLEGVKKKHAGVGYARQVGMDLAITRFSANGTYDGVIISLDADTLVDVNYFTEINKCFLGTPHLYGVIIRFEHLLSGEECSPEVYEAIVAYELHLRYLNLAKKYSGFPYVCHTVGSAFAVSAQAYVKHGGMNRRQGGEDFYFIHKLFPHGDFVELNSTCVYPASRPSDRVPFGTGPEVIAFLESQVMLTYNIKAFDELRAFVAEVPLLYDDVYQLQSPLLTAFLAEFDFEAKLCEIRSNSSSQEAFVKRFFSFFDAFKVVRFLNYAHQDFCDKEDVFVQANELLCKLGYPPESDPHALLALYRKIESR